MDFPFSASGKPAKSCSKHNRSSSLPANASSTAASTDHVRPMLHNKPYLLFDASSNMSEVADSKCTNLASVSLAYGWVGVYVCICVCVVESSDSFLYNSLQIPSLYTLGRAENMSEKFPEPPCRPSSPT